MLLTDPNIKIFISSATFFSLFLFCFGIVQYMRQREKRREMLEKIGRSGVSSIPQYEGVTKNTQDSNFLMPVLNFFKLLGDRISFEPSQESRMKIKFLRAGIRRKNVGTIFWGAKGFFCICLTAVFLIGRLTVFKVLNNQIAMGLF